LNPPATIKEFELTLSKKQRMAEHVHILVTAFLQHVEICCIDGANFFIFEQTHWVKRNAKQVIDLINSFVDRSDVDDRFRNPLRTVPYLKMALEELRLTTQRDALEPMTGNLHDGVFINLENGVLHIDIKTGKRKLLDHESKYNFSTLLPYCYEPAATSPKFDSWISTQIPDKSLHTAYYAFVASCLTKHKADIIMLLVGDTSTGKSSLIEITRRVIGLDNSTAVSAGILFGGTAEAQTQAMTMENKLLAYDFDSQPFKHLEMLLKVAAQEPLPGWQMHVARRPIINYGRLLIAMNKYSYSVFNPAVARRLITIPMDVPVVKDNTVMPAIYDSELAGIFNRVLNVGIFHLLENGGQIKVTDAMRQMTVDFHMRERDSVRWFNANYTILKQSVDVSKRRTAEQKLGIANPGITIKLTNVSELFNQYRTWLEDYEKVSEHKLPIRKHFAADLKLIGVDDQVLKANGETVRGVYLGVVK
jgi:phage/plasmid-associated DNA primase